MLTIAKVAAGAARATPPTWKERRPTRATTTCATGGVEAPGRWVSGRRRRGVGLDRSAGADEPFRALMNVATRSRSSRSQLRRNGQAVVAIDATFSAPNRSARCGHSASPELRLAIESAHERGIDRALQHAASWSDGASTDRLQHGRPRDRPGGPRHELASEHRAAVAGRPPDPQLHSHVVIHGALRSDGRVVAVESRAWMVHQREIAAVYRSQLAAELQRLGFGSNAAQAAGALLRDRRRAGRPA